ncbi:MAG: hypothetical protein K2J08_10620, partial [Ruminococcus sp.]|nr:hypothetical protein [Ruminococcus sp.]
VKSPKILTESPEPINFELPEISDYNLPELDSQTLLIPECEVSGQSEINVKSPKILTESPEPINFELPEISDYNLPEPDSQTLLIPECEVSGQSKINMESPEMTDFEPPEILDFDLPEIKSSGIFSQHIEVLREISPKNQLPDIADERITQEIKSQIDGFTVTLNADNFIEKFQEVISQMGNYSVPQYSEIFGQTRIAEKHESVKIIPTESKNNNIPQLKIFIGNDEIKDFIISSINEANAMSGGVSV